MVAKLPAARDSVLVFSDAEGIEHALIIGSPEWYTWLADEQQRSFTFACPDGSFQARKERKQRGGWYWIAYRRAQGKIHKRYLGKPEELSPARLHAAAAQLSERSAAPAAPPIPIDPSASPMAWSPASEGAWPSGTVTFLFTDLVDSTVLWERYPQAMPAALARHNAIVGHAVEAHDGVVFKMVGDSIGAAFARAPAALSAAVEAQRALHAESWRSTGLPATQPVLVRMALHTGAAEVQAGDYHGPPLNRVARILAAAHGGQILLARTTAELVSEALPPDVTLRDLGQFPLTGLSRPEQLFQLVSPDLPTDFPTLTGATYAASAPSPYILATKLFVPPLRSNVVARPRLIEQLQAGAHGRLTLLSAPAGFGKTTLLSAWLAERQKAKGKRQKEDDNSDAALLPFTFDLLPLNVAWVSLDAGDADPVQFWIYVVTALDQLYPRAGTAALAALQSPQPPPIEALLTPLLNALSTMPHEAVLILDDYHVIAAPPIHQALSFLIERLPPRLHLVIATRSDPPLPLMRLRARGELTELRATDLRFSVEEAAAFLMDSMGLPLTTHDVAALETRTEGWIAGLQLAALAMRDRTNLTAFINAFTGSNRFVMDYLATEVLERLPSHLQSFVFQTAILDRLCGPLCDAVVDFGLGSDMQNPKPAIQNAQMLLEELDRTNLFIVPLDDERKWYRYHHLFAEVAQGRLLASAGAIAAATLHRRASAWYEDAGFVAEAVQHALAAHDWERAARVIEHGGYVGIVRGQLQTVRGWLNTLPDDLVRSRAWLCILHAITLLFTNQLEDAESRLQAAERCMQVDTSAEQPQIMRGHVATIRGAIVHFSGNLAESVTLAARALELLPETEVLSRPLALVLAAHAYRVSGDVTPTTERVAMASIEPVRASGNLLAYLGALLNIAELQVVQGRLHQAAANYREAAHVALGSGGLQVLVGSPAYSFGMADLLRERNDLAGAEQHMAQGMELMQGALTVHADVAALGYLTRARLQQAGGDYAGAQATLATFADLARQRQFDDLVLARGLAAQAQLALVCGNLPAAIQWMIDRGIQASDDLSYVREGEYLTLARVLIARGRSDPAGGYMRDALRLLERLRQSAEAGGRMGVAIETRILQALVLDAQGDRHVALTMLAEALALAAPVGYVRLFADEGAPMAELLREAHKRGITSDYAASLLATFGEVKIENEELRSGAAQAHSQCSMLNAQLPEPLTAREREVLRLVADGASNGEIADQLVITVGTVKRHINNLFGKLGVQSRTQAVRAARDLHLF
jgi:LuxR family maltose regulon positive regulatory protein